MKYGQSHTRHHRSPHFLPMEYSSLYQLPPEQDASSFMENQALAFAARMGNQDAWEFSQAEEEEEVLEPWRFEFHFLFDKILSS